MRIRSLALFVAFVALSAAPASCGFDTEGTGALPVDASADGFSGSGGTSPTLDGSTGGSGGSVQPDASAGSGGQEGGQDAKPEAQPDATEDVVEPDVVEPDVVEPDVVEPDVVEPDVVQDVAIDVVHEPAPTCGDLFGSAPEYVYCEESATTCTFAARTGGGTCTEICQSLGSTCVNAWDNGGDPCVVISWGDTCDTPRSTEICECARP